MAVLLFAQSGEAQTTAAPRCGTGVHEGEAKGSVLFPQDQIFCQFLAVPAKRLQRARQALPSEFTPG